MPKIIHADHEILCFCNFLYTRVEMMFCIGKGSQKNGILLWVFAMKREGSRVPLRLLKKMFKKHLESLPDCQNAFCTKFEFYIMYI